MFIGSRFLVTGSRRHSAHAATVVVLLFTAAALAGSAVSPVSVHVVRDTPDSIVLEYQFPDFTAVTVLIDGQRYEQIMYPGEPQLLAAGAPDLAHVTRSVILPDDGVMAINVTASRYHDVANVDLAPSKGVLSRQINPADVPFTFGPEYATDAFFPGGELARLHEPYILRDYRGTVVDVFPFHYNPVTRTLRAYTSMTVELTRVALGGSNVLVRNRDEHVLSLAFHELYGAQFLNYGTRGGRYAPLDENGGLLIICYDPWLTNVQPLVNYKNSIGIPTTLVGVSTIGNNSTAIKSYIQTYYNTHDLAFVLLVGDAAQVATPSASGGASDPTYSKLAGGDNYPDIMVGRFSAETAAHVDTQVLRSVEYEQMPATQQTWFWKGTGIGSEFGPGDDNEYDYQHIDNIRTQLLAHSYTQVDQLYGAGATAAQVTNALNTGRGIMNYCGHGSQTSWGTTGFSSANVAALRNDNMLPFVFSVACVNGEFNTGTCFAEAWLRSVRGAEPIGAIGAYMSSINQSWNSPMQAQDEFNARYVVGTYHSFGTLCYAGSCSMMDAYGADGVNMFNTWHVFGDPSLRIVGVGTTDTTPPTPNPMTFAAPPAPASTTSIGMTATTATDSQSPPVAYYFNFVSGGPGGNDSAWQAGTGYTDSGLTPNTSYTYRVKARDSATPTPNETAYSTNAATATWIETPTGVSFGTVGSNSIELNATGTLTNLTVGSSGVYFDSTTAGGDGGINAWVQAATDTATGLSPNTLYTFQVKARNQNGAETAYSPTASKVTLANVPAAPVLSNVTQTALQLDVGPNGNPPSTEFAVLCNATADPTWSGKYVDATGNPSTSAVWRTDAAWGNVSVQNLDPATQYCFQVKARNSDLIESAFSTQTCATTGSLRVRGDMNCDGAVNFADIDAFVDVLGGGACCDPTGYNCDVNGDGLVDFNDIDPFVALLGG